LANEGKMTADLTQGNTPVVRRVRPGTKSDQFFSWPDESLEEMDSTLAVQQYIQQTIRRDPTNIVEILNAPEGQDEGVWKYEHLRQFCLELNGLAIKLQAECNPESCSQMTATEQWIFLCAAHKTPKECPAMDYTRHTLDGAVSPQQQQILPLSRVDQRVFRRQTGLRLSSRVSHLQSRLSSPQGAL